MYYDLHIHSNMSDGKYTKEEILKKYPYFEYISFTDHDYIEDSSYLNDNRIIEGVEITIGNYNSMHMLSYDVKNISLIKKQLDEINRENILICKRLLDNLKNYYQIDLTIPDYKLNKGIIREELVKNGYCKNRREAGDIYTGQKSKFYEKTIGLNYQDAIALIKESGGISILAHPSTLKLDKEELEKLLKELKDLGLDGIEVLNLSKTTLEEYNLYNFLASKYNFLKTCGSDYHNEIETPKIGICNDISKEFIKTINKRR